MRILFICLGNICRSSAAQTIMQHLVDEEGLGALFEIDSAGILSYHQGEQADPRMRAHAARRGYNVTHRSRPVTAEDFRRFDLIIGMDEGNIDDLKENQQAGGTTVPPKEPEVVDNAIVEVPATYPGGEAALLNFVSKNLVYPAIAQEQELQGVVVLRFKVDVDGSVSTVKVEKSLSRECDQAAADVVKKLHRFVPAKQQGHPVPVWFRLPIRFRIQ